MGKSLFYRTKNKKIKCIKKYEDKENQTKNVFIKSI